MPALRPGQPVQYLRTDQAAVPEQTKISCIADTGAYEVSLVTFPAVASLTQADYFSFSNKAGDTFAVWFDIDAAGITPTGAAYTAATTKIEVDVVTGNTAIQVAAAAVAAIGVLFSDVTVLNNLDGSVLFTQDLIGTCVDAAPHNANDSGPGSLLVSISAQGAASNLQSTYLQMQEGDGSSSRYVWMNVGSEGVDPAGTGAALECSLSAGGSASAIATAVAAGINADADFVASAAGSDVYVWNALSGNALDATANDTGFTVSIVAQGYDQEENAPGGNLAASSPSPSLHSATT